MDSFDVFEDLLHLLCDVDAFVIVVDVGGVEVYPHISVVHIFHGLTSHIAVGN